ncbi:MAG: flagellar hook-length control protein FliK [Sideroxydans sp.]
MNPLPTLSASTPDKLSGNPAATAAGKDEATTDGAPFGQMLARQLGKRAATADKPEVLKKSGARTAHELQATLPVLPGENGEAGSTGNAPDAAQVSADLLATLPPALPVHNWQPGLAASESLGKPATRADRHPGALESRDFPPAAAADGKITLPNELEDAVPLPFATAPLATAASTSQPLSSPAENGAVAGQSLTAVGLLPSTVALATQPALPAAIATPVGQAQWADDFSQKITWLATQNRQQAELHLNPPHLGPLEVTLKLNGDQATALFSSPHAAVREAIEQSLPKLREMFADNGIMLGGATVSDPSQHGQHSESGNPSPTGLDIRRAETVGTAENLLPSRVRQHDGMVDTFA